MSCRSLPSYGADNGLVQALRRQHERSATFFELLHPTGKSKCSTSSRAPNFPYSEMAGSSP